jgi:ABC-type enterochelin transport system permease subunit
MNQIPWGSAAAIFVGTLPLLGVMVWNVVEVRTFRSEVRAEFAQIGAELVLIRECLAALEGSVTA